MVVKVEVGHESKEDKLRKQVNELMSLTMILHKSGINADKFLAEMTKIIGKSEIDVFEIMDTFCELEKGKKIEIIELCGVEEKPIFNLNLMAEELNKTVEYVPQHNNMSEMTESELKKRIKYCKNPLEKQKLQRELSSLKFMEGKHRKGKRK